MVYLHLQTSKREQLVSPFDLMVERKADGDDN
jgi:hypothetical protein